MKSTARGGLFLGVSVRLRGLRCQDADGCVDADVRDRTWVSGVLASPGASYILLMAASPMLSVPRLRRSVLSQSGFICGTELRSRSV